MAVGTYKGNARQSESSVSRNYRKRGVKPINQNQEKVSLLPVSTSTALVLVIPYPMQKSRDKVLLKASSSMWGEMTMENLKSAKAVSLACHKAKWKHRSAWYHFESHNQLEKKSLLLHKKLKFVSTPLC